jgi:hypothetical protein
MQIDHVALELDVVQLDLVLLVAAGLHGQRLGVSREPLQSGKHVPYGHPPRERTAQSRRSRPPGNGPAGQIGDTAERMVTEGQLQ